MTANAHEPPNEPETSLVKAGQNGHQIAPAVGHDPETGEMKGVDATPYMGMSASTFTKEEIATLLRPTEADIVEIRPDDGIVYVPAVHYRARLLEAFGPGAWALHPRGTKLMGTVVTYQAALFIRGNFMSEAVGEMRYISNNPKMSYATSAEGAKSDCLTRCCKDLGLFRELWDPAWRRAWVEKYAYNGQPPKSAGPTAKVGWYRKDADQRTTQFNDTVEPVVEKPRPAAQAAPKVPASQGPNDSDLKEFFKVGVEVFSDKSIDDEKERAKKAKEYLREWFDNATGKQLHELQLEQLQGLTAELRHASAFGIGRETLLAQAETAMLERKAAES